MIGEGIKDNAPGIFLGDQLGTWRTRPPSLGHARVRAATSGRLRLRTRSAAAEPCHHPDPSDRRLQNLSTVHTAISFY
ncbi:MAG: hypothetical protein M3463_03445 [Verrucomicrobiota bacterium]|nr:hypothetical protein [Verrucomicrobiota bacterium]